MTVQNYLADLGISVEEAKSFIMENLDDVEKIHNVAKEFGVNNDMLAQVLQDQIPGLTKSTVEDFFSQHGIDASDLDENPLTSDFIMKHMDNIKFIHDVAKEYGVTSDELAQTLQDKIPGITKDAIDSFFSQHGIDASDLDEFYPNAPTDMIPSNHSLNDDDGDGDGTGDGPNDHIAGMSSDESQHTLL